MRKPRIYFRGGEWHVRQQPPPDTWAGFEEWVETTFAGARETAAFMWERSLSDTHPQPDPEP